MSGAARRVVIAAEPVTSVDVTAANMLADLHEVLAAQGVELSFAELKDPVRDKLRRFELLHLMAEGRAFRTIGEPVDSYCA